MRAFLYAALGVGMFAWSGSASALVRDNTVTDGGQAVPTTTLKLKKTNTRTDESKDQPTGKVTTPGRGDKTKTAEPPRRPVTTHGPAATPVRQGSPSDAGRATDTLIGIGIGIGGGFGRSGGMGGMGFGGGRRPSGWRRARVSASPKFSNVRCV